MVEKGMCLMAMENEGTGQKFCLDNNGIASGGVLYKGNSVENQRELDQNKYIGS